MTNLSKLSSNDLQDYLRNAIRFLERKPEQAKSLLPDIVSQMLARRLSEEPIEHILATLGYNLRWKDWHAKERKQLIGWILGAELPAEVQNQIGPAKSERR